MINVNLSGQTAVVTGASRGIGLAVTRVLAASGAHVVAGALHSSAELGKLAAEGSVTISELDLAAPGGPADLVALAGTRVDILVNNVGGAPPRTSGFLAITDEEWLATLNLNLMTAVRASRVALPAMLAAGRSVDRSRRLLVLVILDQRPEGEAMINVNLTGQTAVVTGASRGIGLAVTRVLAASGAHVVAGALHSSAELGKLAAEGSVTISELDLAAPGGPADLVALAGTRVDILVNNVGGAPPRTSGFLAITDEEWLATLNLNLMTAVRASRAALPAMLAAGQGAIVNICSVNSVLSDPAVMDYSAAKAAVASFSKALSKEVGPKGIRVNTVSPGPVATDLWLGANGVAATVGNATGARPEDVASSAASEMVTGRFSRPEEVADLVLLLASDVTANVTGADIRIDGGLVPTW